MNEEEENKITEQAYRAALYDMFTAMLGFMSVEDTDWLMHRLISYCEWKKEKARR